MSIPKPNDCKYYNDCKFKNDQMCPFECGMFDDENIIKVSIPCYEIYCYDCNKEFTTTDNIYKTKSVKCPHCKIEIDLSTAISEN